jgi:hypothetical protein
MCSFLNTQGTSYAAANNMTIYSSRIILFLFLNSFYLFGRQTKQIIVAKFPIWSKISYIMYSLQIYMLILSSLIIYISVKQQDFREKNISKLIRVTNPNLRKYVFFRLLSYNFTYTLALEARGLEFKSQLRQLTFFLFLKIA